MFGLLLVLSFMQRSFACSCRCWCNGTSALACSASHNLLSAHSTDNLYHLFAATARMLDAVAGAVVKRIRGRHIYSFTKAADLAALLDAYARLQVGKTLFDLSCMPFFCRFVRQGCGQ